MVCIEVEHKRQIEIMAQKSIAFREPHGCDLKKIGHSLEMNVSELVTAALREYLKKRNIEV